MLNAPRYHEDLVPRKLTLRPVCSGEQRILQLAASIADGTLVSLRQAIPGLDNRNLKLLITAIRHAAGLHLGR